MTDLGTLGGRNSYAYGINAGGQVVGGACITGGANHAFLYNGSTMHDLGTLGGSDSYAYGINAGGQVVGQACTDDAAWHAFLYSGSAIKDLGTLGGTNSYAYGINDGGQVVGQSNVAGGGSHAFLYSDSTMCDLNTLMDPLSGWTLQNAQDINNAGQIVGSGYNGTQYHAFLLTPSNTAREPSSLALLVAGLIGTIGWAWRRNNRNGRSNGRMRF